MSRQANIPDIPYPVKPPAPPPPIISSKTASESLTLGFTSGSSDDDAGEWWTSSGSTATSTPGVVSALDLPEDEPSASESEELLEEEIQADLLAEIEQAALTSSTSL